MSEKKSRFLFLYSRLPEYFFRCIEYLVSIGCPGSMAWIVCYENDENAPYKRNNINSSIKITGKNELNSLQSWAPELIYVAGWADNDYNKIARIWKKKVPVIFGVDNPWKGTIKQKIATYIGNAFIKKMATNLWVPGYPQYEFVRRLGFPANRILFNLYCADVDKFYRKENSFRKRIIYAGRMVEYKRPHWLTEIFSEIVTTSSAFEDWELLMVGNGPLYEKLKHQYGHVRQITIIPFVQPDELVQLYHQSCIFCMPSLNEHWGLVVHEAAAAGLVLLLSDTCGAASSFLIHGFNGSLFRSMEKSDFKKQLLSLMEKQEPELNVMGEGSRELSGKISLAIWAASLMSARDRA